MSYEPWIQDDYLVPIPWRSVVLPPTLKIAVMYTDNIVTPSPPISRALKSVVASLVAAGHEVVEWKAEGHDECWDITQALYYEDGGRAVEKLIADGGEDMLPLTKWLIKDNDNVKYRTVEDVWTVRYPSLHSFSNPLHSANNPFLSSSNKNAMPIASATMKCGFLPLLATRSPHAP
jgi:amidase